MKVKLKNASGAARFFLSHGEKLGMAAVAIVAGLLITSSLGRPGLDKRPDDLTNSAKAATDHYQQMSWEKIAQTNPTEVVDASKVVDLPAKAFVSPVDIDAFPPLPLINPPVVDEVSLRKDPALLAVLSLEANGGSGMWASADPEAIKRNFLDAIKKQEEQRMKQDEEQRKAEEGGPEGGGGERGGFGGRGGGEGFGGPGMMGVGAITADKVLVLPPPTGAMTQGFEDIKIRSWVTVVGKVPVKKQFDAYEAALSMSHGYSSQTDMPIYKGYQVQRAEVTEAGVGEWANLANVVDKTILADMAKSPIPSVDPINPKYNHPLLTHPLPSMLLRQWGKEVTHSELPIPTPEDLLRESMGPEATTPEGTADKPKNKEPGANADDPFADTNKRSQLPPGAGGEMGFGRGGGGRGEMGMGGRGGGLGGRGGMMGGRGEMGGSGYGRGEMGGGRGEMGGGGFGRGEGGMGMMRPPGLGADGSAEMMLPEYAWDGTTKFALFRYFDATVQPGHRYRYRVRLVLADVNADKLDKYLDKEVTERKKANKARYRFTEYSEPSTTASVPEPGLAYVAGAKVSASAAIEGEAKLVVKALDPLHAAEGALGGAYSRGSVLNHLASKAEIIWSSSPDLTQPDVASGKVPESPDFDFVTDLAVLDFQGGESLNKSRELTAPTTVLLMDGSGKMMLKEELDDRLTVQEYTMILEHKKQAEKAAREGAGGGPGEGRGGGGRGGGGRGGRG